jgi:hypothetical protein
MKPVLVPVLALALTLLAYLPCSAQLNVGLTAGLELPKGNNGTSEFQNNLVFGGFAELALSSPFSLRVEMQYSKKEASVTIPGLDGGGSSSDGGGMYSLNYMQFPVDMRLNFGSADFRGFVFGGTTIGTLMSAVREAKGLDADGGNGLPSTPAPATIPGMPTTDQLFNTVDMTLDLGGGASYAIAKDLFFSGEVRYMFGMDDTEDGDGSVLKASNWSARSMKIMTGLSYSF